MAGATITDNGWHLIEMQWDTSSATVWTADWRVDLVAQPRATWNTTSLGLSPAALRRDRVRTAEGHLLGDVRVRRGRRDRRVMDHRRYRLVGQWDGVVLQPGGDGTHTFTGSNASKGQLLDVHHVGNDRRLAAGGQEHPVATVYSPPTTSPCGRSLPSTRNSPGNGRRRRPEGQRGTGAGGGERSRSGQRGQGGRRRPQQRGHRERSGRRPPDGAGRHNGSSFFFNHIAPNNEFFSRAVPTPAAGWTPTEIAAIRLRVGCATGTVATVPTLQAAMFEVDWPGVPLTPGAQAVSKATATVAGAVGYDRVILADSPRLYINAAAADDGSGHHHAVIAVGGPANAQDPGLDPCYAFNGVNQYLEVADADDLSPAGGAITLEMWIRPDTLQFLHAEDTGYVHFAGKGDFNDPTGPPYARGEYMARMYNLANTEVAAAPQPDLGLRLQQADRHRGRLVLPGPGHGRRVDPLRARDQHGVDGGLQTRAGTPTTRATPRSTRTARCATRTPWTHRRR